MNSIEEQKDKSEWDVFFKMESISVDPSSSRDVSLNDASSTNSCSTSSLLNSSEEYSSESDSNDDTESEYESDVENKTYRKPMRRHSRKSKRRSSSSNKRLQRRKRKQNTMKMEAEYDDEVREEEDEEENDVEAEVDLHKMNESGQPLFLNYLKQFNESQNREKKEYTMIPIGNAMKAHYVIIGPNGNEETHIVAPDLTRSIKAKTGISGTSTKKKIFQPKVKKPAGRKEFMRMDLSNSNRKRSSDLYSLNRKRSSNSKVEENIDGESRDDEGSKAAPTEVRNQRFFDVFGVTNDKTNTYDKSLNESQTENMQENDRDCEIFQTSPIVHRFSRLFQVSNTPLFSPSNDTDDEQDTSKACEDSVKEVDAEVPMAKTGGLSLLRTLSLKKKDQEEAKTLSKSETKAPMKGKDQEETKVLGEPDKKATPKGLQSLVPFRNKNKSKDTDEEFTEKIETEYKSRPMLNFSPRNKSIQVETGSFGNIQIKVKKGGIADNIEEAKLSDITEKGTQNPDKRSISAGAQQTTDTKLSESCKKMKRRGGVKNVLRSAKSFLHIPSNMSKSGDNGICDSRSDDSVDNPMLSPKRTISLLRSRSKQKAILNLEEDVVVSNELIEYHKFGGDSKDALQLVKRKEALVPASDSEEVLIQVEASSVSKIDCDIRNKRLYVVDGNAMLPLTPGINFIGSVVSCGSKATMLYGINKKDRVASLVQTGGNCKFLVEHANQLVRVPRSIKPEKAAVILESYLAAFQVLLLGVEDEHRYERFPLKGKHILILEGILHVNQAMIELAVYLGAEKVYTTALFKHFDFLRGLGASPLDFEKKTWLPCVEGKMDIVVNSSVENNDDCHWSALNPNGRLICHGVQANLHLESGCMTTLEHFWARTKSGFMPRTHSYDIFSYWEENLQESKMDLTFLFGLLEKKLIHPTVADTLPLKKVPKAHTILDGSRRVQGSLVCLPWSG